MDQGRFDDSVPFDAAGSPVPAPRHGGSGGRRPSWRSLPRRAKTFRIAHVAWGIVALLALVYIWAAAIVRHRDRLLKASIAVLLVQGMALLLGRGNCPCGPIQRCLGDPVPMFELVLPPRTAKAAIPVLLLAAIAAMVVVIVRPPPRVA